MKKLIIILLVIVANSQLSKAQIVEKPGIISLSAMFREMLTWMNNDNSYGSGTTKSIELLMTNNTMRLDGAGNPFQYLSFASGTSQQRRLGGSPVSSFLSFTNCKQSFFDKGTLTRDRDLVDYKIYTEGGGIKVQVVLKTWGNATSVHDAEIFPTTSKGYAIQFTSTDGSGYTDYFTLMLRPVVR
jgi:hypothetical protein